MDIINAILGAFIGMVMAVLILIVYNKLNQTKK
jgi:hypothetical protein